MGDCDASKLSISDNICKGFEIAEDFVHNFCQSQWDNQWTWLSDGENKIGKRTSGDLWVYTNFTQSELLLTDSEQGVNVDFTLHDDELIITAFYDQNGKMIYCSIEENRSGRYTLEKPEGAKTVKGFLLKNYMPLCCSSIYY